MKRHSSDLVARRWKLLKRALLSAKPPASADLASVSIRRFSSFHLVHTEYVRTEEGTAWFRYTLPQYHHIQLHISHCQTSRDDLQSFNNTGNVCVWPSEEILTLYCLRNADRLKGRRICELGGGMTCLAGVAVAKLGIAEHVLLTDGNKKSVENVARIIEENDLKAECRTLRWDVEHPELHHQFDLIISADCLFFDQFRLSLVNTLDTLLTDSGEVWIFAPTRNQTLNDFVHLAGDKFITQIYHDYDHNVSEVHKDMTARGMEHYDSNLHYPFLVKLCRKKIVTSK